MKRIILIFGITSGIITSALMLLSAYLCTKGLIDFDNGEVIGYSGMVLAFLLVYFGVRAYRDNTGGTLTFGRAFKVGLLIVLISSVFYVVTWQLVYFQLWPEFPEQFTAHMLEDMRSKGASPETIEAKRRQIAEFKKYYDNPLINSLVTLIEPLPVGLLAALISAAILRRKPSGTAPEVAVA